MGLEPSIFVFFSPLPSVVPVHQSWEVPGPSSLGVSENRGVYPKTDGENNGKPYVQMDDLGVLYHYFRKHPCSWWPSPTTKKQCWVWTPAAFSGENYDEIPKPVCFWTFLRGIPVLNHSLGCQCQVALFAQNLYRWRSMDEKGNWWFLHSSLIWNHWGEKSCQK